MNLAPTDPFLAIALPDGAQPAIGLYEEGPLAAGERLLPFDLLDGGCGMHDLDADVVRLYRDDETTLPASSISWTGRCVAVDADGSVSASDECADGGHLLYASWFRSTPRRGWTSAIVDLSESDPEDHGDLEIDEDAAYEEACDPERRAVAMAYAA